MRDSTSSGVIPGAFMMIFTWVGEMSGKASMGMVRTAHQPAGINRDTSSNMSSRWVSENRTSPASDITGLPHPCQRSFLSEPLYR